VLTGPLGSYRIFLGHKYYNKYKDTGYIDVLHKTLSVCNSFRNKYLLKPFGQLPWY